MVRSLFLLACAVSFGWAQSDSLWTPEHSLRIQRVGAVVPSPDGGSAVWTQTRAITEGERASTSPTSSFIEMPRHAVDTWGEGRR